MKETKITFSRMGITSEGSPRRVVHYPALWIFNPLTGETKQFGQLLLGKEITKRNLVTIGDPEEYVFVMTKENFFSFDRESGELIAKVGVETLSGTPLECNPRGIIFREGNHITLYDRELKKSSERDLTQEEIEELDG